MSSSSAGSSHSPVCGPFSIALVVDEANVLLAFGSMRGVLRDGGILVLIHGTTDRQWREKPRFLPWSGITMTRQLTRQIVLS